MVANYTSYGLSLSEFYPMYEMFPGPEIFREDRNFLVSYEPQISTNIDVPLSDVSFFERVRCFRIGMWKCRTYGQVITISLIR